MPRWLFLTCIAALLLAVAGSVIVSLRGTPSAAPAASLCGPVVAGGPGQVGCPEAAPSAR